MGEGLVDHGRSLAETPTWSVATVTTVMVFVCLLVERSIYRFGKWLKKTKRKALYASLEKIKEELMLLGLISLMLGQWARWISKICVDSSLFNSRFYLCSEEDIGVHKHLLLEEHLPHSNNSVIPPKGLIGSFHHYCGLGKEPFVSLEGLEQLHKFLFVLGITYVFYSCLAVGLAMTKIYSWRKWENEACILAIAGNQHGTVTNRLMRRQTTFAIHHASHPWSRNKILVWMLCFLRQFKSSIRKSDYLALRLGFLTNHRLHLSYNFHKYMVRSMEDKFHAIVGISWPLWGYAILCIIINIHGLNIYFYLSFIPVILVMLVGTKLQHVVSKLALEVANTSASGPPAGIQVKPRDELFWFGKPGILLKLIQFISFQNAFEMATFIWSLWGFKQRSCFMNNHGMIVVRLASGLIVQFWCSYSTVPLTVIITQMGSKCKKALVAESVRESLHSWCKRVKEKSKHSHAARSVCSIDEAEETTTVASLTLSPCSSVASLNEIVAVEEANSGLHTDDQSRVENRGGEIVGLERISSGARRHHGIDNDHLSFRLSEYISQSAKNSFIHHEDMDRGDGNHMEEDIDRIDVVEGGDFRDGIVDEDVELGGDCDRIEEEEEEPKFETLFDFLERTPRDL